MKRFPLLGPEMQKIHLHRKQSVWSVLGSVSRSDNKAYGTIFVLLDSPWAVLEACEICKAKCMKIFPLFGPKMQKIHLHRKQSIWSVLGSVSRSDKKVIGDHIYLTR